MLQTAIPEPAVMPIDRVEWAEQLHLSNFVNSYYQFRDLQSLDDIRSVLIVGPGQGLDTQVLRWRGYEVTTFDIDETFHPDCVGSVHDLGEFHDQEFDAIVVSHVLEHLAVPLLDKSLSEIARVARHALIYLPPAGRHMQMRLIPGFRDLDLSFVVDLFNFFHKPDGVTARYCKGMHFWEVGVRGFRLRDLKKRLLQHFEILASYRNKDWIFSHNFVLKSKSAR